MKYSFILILYKKMNVNNNYKVNLLFAKSR